MRQRDLSVRFWFFLAIAISFGVITFDLMIAIGPLMLQDRRQLALRPQFDPASSVSGAPRRREGRENAALHDAFFYAR